MQRFIITNGDSAVARINGLEIAGTVLAWRDVLHDGPVCAHDDLASQSAERARFIAGFAAEAPAQIAADFKARDAAFLQAIGQKRIELWFEQDLYDQLQLMQILHVIEQTAPATTLYLVQADDYLCELSDDAFAQLPMQAKSLSGDEKTYGAQGWQAVCASSPFEIERFLQQEAALPYIKTALSRLLQEYPDSLTGLPMSMTYALSLFETQKTVKLVDLFRHMQTCESAKFMGDLSFARHVERLLQGKKPLLSGKMATMGRLETYRDFVMQEVTLTSVGEKVLAGEENVLAHIADNRWIGGVQLCGGQPYFYDAEAAQIVTSAQK